MNTPLQVNYFRKEERRCLFIGLGLLPEMAKEFMQKLMAKELSKFGLIVKKDNVV